MPPKSYFSGVFEVFSQQRSYIMRHIDDGYSYEFYSYQQDVIDYYRRKSDYDIEESEREFRDMKVRVVEEENDSTFSFGTF